MTKFNFDRLSNNRRLSSREMKHISGGTAKPVSQDDSDKSMMFLLPKKDLFGEGRFGGA